MKADITLEFYHKKAIYSSPKTGGKTNIDIQDVFFEIHTHPYKEGEPIKKYSTVTVRSTTGIDYSLTDLTF